VKAVILISVLAFASPAVAQFNQGIGSNSFDHHVSGHMTSSCTYVSPHYQTNPNSTTPDSYGASRNFNPHTGGSVEAIKAPSSPSMRLENG
jgi:hypothetical protein